MVGDIKAISPCVKSASAKLFLDLHTVSALSGEERTLNAAAQVERATVDGAAAAHRDARARLSSLVYFISLSLARARVRVYGGRESEGRGAGAIRLYTLKPCTSMNHHSFNAR